MTMRTKHEDELKSERQQQNIFTKNITCAHTDCNELITFFKGPGSDKYCREHQLQLINYGGYGRSGREHTFHRADVCDCCGQDINDDPRWAKAEYFFGTAPNERQRHEIKRRYNHADHDHRKADGGEDIEENINKFCSFCHWYKTVINNDGRRAETG